MVDISDNKSRHRYSSHAAMGGSKRLLLDKGSSDTVVIDSVDSILEECDGLAVK
jgi:hypothetical protein